MMHLELFLIFAAIILVVVAVNQLWTSLLLGSIVHSQYRARWHTNDDGAQTGAYVRKTRPDGTGVLKPVGEDEEEEAELRERIDELEPEAKKVVDELWLYGLQDSTNR